MKRNELIVLSALIVLAVACILSTAGGSVLILQDESLPAHLYSNVLAGILIAACIGRMVMLLAFRKDVPVTEQSSTGNIGNTILIALIAVFYTFGISYIGFYVSTFISMFVLYLGFEQWNRSKIRTGLVFSLGLCLVFFISFSQLKIYLPDGWLF